jgi:hypothetical protein
MNRIVTNTSRLQSATSFLPLVIFFMLLLTGAAVAQTTTSSATDMKLPRRSPRARPRDLTP